MLILESKDSTCDGILCERANSHGTLNFTGNKDQQAEFRNVLLCPEGVQVRKAPTQCNAKLRES